MKAGKKKILYIVILAIVVVFGAGCVYFRTVSDKNQKVKEAYKVGTIEGNHYESEWLGLQFDAPEGFHMYTRKELNYRTEEAEEEVSDSGMTMDMCASSNEVGSVTITVEKREDEQMSAEKYVQEQRDSMLENDGKGMEFQDKGDLFTETIAGQEYAGMKMEYTLDDLNMCEETYVRMIDDCVVVIKFVYEPGDTDGRDSMYQALRQL